MKKIVSLALSFFAVTGAGCSSFLNDSSSLASPRLEKILDKMDAVSSQKNPDTTRVVDRILMGKMLWNSTKMMASYEKTGSAQSNTCKSVSTLNRHLKEINGIIAKSGVTNETIDISDLQIDRNEFQSMVKTHNCTLD